MTAARNEAARRLGIPVCEVCSEPDCEPRREKGLTLNARLCNRCYVDFLRREVRRELREEENR
jgi:hypothetical protein